jgi:hypothetical protein
MSRNSAFATETGTACTTLARAEEGFALPPLQPIAHAASKNTHASPIVRRVYSIRTDAGGEITRDSLPALRTPDTVVIQVSFKEELDRIQF